MHRTRVVEVLVLVLLSAPVCLGCLWDYDTLAAEARGRPGTAEVLVGLVDRWPDAVYEERLARREVSIVQDPAVLARYDDAGVACDRLGRHDEAIVWMARKRDALDALETPDTEHEYRYHANLGTFYVHRWIAGGADRDDLSDVERARDHITRAIDINPKAHFGREVVQLRLIEWLIAGEVPQDAYEGLYPGEGYEERSGKIVDGLVGLVELGNAWGSVDVFYAIGDEAQWYEGTIAYLAWLRAEELVDAGSSGLLTSAESLEIIEHVRDGEHLLHKEMATDVEAWWREARASADARNAAREAYILERRDGGTHPDDVGWDVFFAGWTEPRLPEMPDTRHTMSPQEVGRIVYSAIVVVLCAAAIAVGLVVRHRLLKGRASAPERGMT